MRWNNETIHCDILFTRSVHDCDSEFLQSFLGLHYSTKITRNGENQMCWTPIRSTIFELKSYYKALINRNPHFFTWKSFWKVKVPTKVAFFTWITARGKILTMDNLRKRNICIVEWCCL